MCGLESPRKQWVHVKDVTFNGLSYGFMVCSLTCLARWAIVEDHNRRKRDNQGIGF
jgi:hypothetical protein